MDTTEVIDAAAMNLGYRSLKPEQREAIRNFMDGKNVMVVLPSFGKSLCYILLPTAFDYEQTTTGSRYWYFEFSLTRTQRFLLSVIQFPHT